MATFKIPVPTTTDPFSQQVELDGLIYDLTFLWNSRDSHWSLTIARSDVVLIRGIKLITINALASGLEPDNDLLYQFRRIEDMPPGKLYIQDLDGLDRDPDGTTFGDRVILIYEEES